MPSGGEGGVFEWVREGQQQTETNEKKMKKRKNEIDARTTCVSSKPGDSFPSKRCPVQLYQTVQGLRGQIDSFALLNLAVSHISLV